MPLMFAYDAFNQNRGFVITVLVHLNIGHRGAVPGHNTTLRRVHILPETDVSEV